MLSPDLPRTITLRSTLFAVIDPVLLPEDLIEDLTLQGALILGTAPEAGTFYVRQDPDHLGLRGEPLSDGLEPDLLVDGHAPRHDDPPADPSE